MDRGKQGMKRSLLVDGCGIPLGRVLAPAKRNDSPLLAPTLDELYDLGPLPDDITVHLDAAYDAGKTRDEVECRGLTGEGAHEGDKAPIQAGRRWHIERTNAWHNAFVRLARWWERRTTVIDAFFDLADTIITIRSRIRQATTTHRWTHAPDDTADDHLSAGPPGAPRLYGSRWRDRRRRRRNWCCCRLRWRGVGPGRSRVEPVRYELHESQPLRGWFEF